LTLLPGERSRLHVDLDMQAADAMSYRTLMSDLAALYLGRDLPELGYSYREYRQAIARQEAQPQPARDADRDWWAQRIPQLPDPPMPPTVGGRDSRQSTRRWHWLDRRLATRCSRVRGPVESPRRWRWPRRSPTRWRAGRPARGSC